MISCKRIHLESRCRQRGFTLDEVWPCVVHHDGDELVVDETHPAYPKSPRPDVAPPPLSQRLANFATSAAKHIAGGMTRCTQEQVDARYAVCQQCEHLQNGLCVKCGCPLVRERQFISKLSWASEECPIGKWGKVLPSA